MISQRKLVDVGEMFLLCGNWERLVWKGHSLCGCAHVYLYSHHFFCLDFFFFFETHHDFYTFRGPEAIKLRLEFDMFAYEG